MTLEKGEKAFSKGRVLVVDDEPDIVEYLTTLLQENGYETEHAGDADEGMLKTRGFSPHLICMDIMMPKKTGLAMLRTLRRDPGLRQIPVMLVTAFGKTSDFSFVQLKELVAGEGMTPPDACMEKPIDRNLFIETVGRLIGKGAEARR
ncbi:MAG: response regulator [bacterium]